MNPPNHSTRTVARTVAQTVAGGCLRYGFPLQGNRSVAPPAKNRRYSCANRSTRTVATIASEASRPGPQPIGPIVQRILDRASAGQAP